MAIICPPTLFNSTLKKKFIERYVGTRGVYNGGR